MKKEEDRCRKRRTTEGADEVRGQMTGAELLFLRGSVMRKMQRGEMRRKKTYLNSLKKIRFKLGCRVIPEILFIELYSRSFFYFYMQLI